MLFTVKNILEGELENRMRNFDITFFSEICMRKCYEFLITVCSFKVHQIFRELYMLIIVSNGNLFRKKSFLLDQEIMRNL